MLLCLTLGLYVMGQIDRPIDIIDEQKVLQYTVVRHYFGQAVGTGERPEIFFSTTRNLYVVRAVTIDAHQLCFVLLVQFTG